MKGTEILLGVHGTFFELVVNSATKRQGDHTRSTGKHLKLDYSWPTFEFKCNKFKFKIIINKKIKIIFLKNNQVEVAEADQVLY